MARKSSHVDPAAVLAANPVFSGLTPAQLSGVASQIVIKQYTKGYLLFSHEEEAAWFYLIAEGWVKLFRETLDGNEALLDILTDGHIFGETSIFGNGRYSTSAQALEDTTLLVLPVGALKRLIEEEPRVAVNMLGSMTRFRQQQEREMEHRSLQNASQRIGCFLLRLCEDTNAAQATLHLPYDKTLIAARLGMKPETFSRALGRLKEDTGLIVRGATVQIKDIPALAEYTCSACSDVFPCEDKC